MASSLMVKKPIPDLLVETDAAHGGLKREMTLSELTALGIGATVGTGIFFVLEDVVPTAGPAVIFAFLLAGITAGLAALCYAELASTIPVSGSSYSYAYTVLGELVAYFIGWCLLLEYGLAAAATSIGWSGYLNELFSQMGFTIPDALINPPSEGGVMNLPAALLVGLCCLLLLRGSAESAKANLIMVCIKIGVLILFIVIAFSAFNSGNFSPFLPFGVAGVLAATSPIFFTFIGIDAISTAGEEVANPKRTLPLAIIAALVTVTTLYVLTAVAAIGAQPVAEFTGENGPELADIMKNVTGQTWPATILSIGAVISIFSVTLVTIYGQTRILFSMSRDGLMPKAFHEVDTRTGIPRKNTIIVCVVIAGLAAFIPLDWIWDMVSIGTLTAFATVSLAVILLRRSQPDLDRGFTVPGGPYLIPGLSIICCLAIISSVAPAAFLTFAAWMVLALITYVLFAYKNSVLRRDLDAAENGGNLK